MTCEQCGATLEPDSAFCDTCGSKQSVTALAPPARVPSGGAPPPALSAPNHDDGSDGSGHSITGTLADLKVMGSEHPNAHYLGQRLLYESSAETFIGQFRELMWARLIMAVKVAVYVWLIGLGLGLLGLGFLYARGSLLEDESGSGFGVWVLLLTAACLVYVAVTVFRKRALPVSEWKMLLDGKGLVADAVYNHIGAALVERRSPVQVRSVSTHTTSWRGHLQVRSGDWHASVSCFPFGQDLYVGWTLWWLTSIARALSHYETLPTPSLGTPAATPDNNGGFPRPVSTSSPVLYELRYAHQFDDAKALRECVHAVTRQGVEAAIGKVPLRGRGTIGSVIPEGAEATFVTTSSAFSARPPK